MINTRGEILLGGEPLAGARAADAGRAFARAVLGGGLPSEARTPEGDRSRGLPTRRYQLFSIAERDNVGMVSALGG